MKIYKVMFVDDNPMILQALKRSVRNEEYETIFISTAEKALEEMEQQEIAVVVSDINLPGMDGIKMLSEIEKRYPRTLKLALTGVNDMEDVYEIFEQVDIYKYFTKPWNIERLKNDIHNALEAYNCSEEKPVF